MVALKPLYVRFSAVHLCRAPVVSEYLYHWQRAYPLFLVTLPTIKGRSPHPLTRRRLQDVKFVRAYSRRIHGISLGISRLAKCLRPRILEQIEGFLNKTRHYGSTIGGLFGSGDQGTRGVQHRPAAEVLDRPARRLYHCSK